MATISISGPSDGQTIDASDVNTPLATIVAAINGNLDNDNIKTGAGIEGSKLAANSLPPTVYDANARGGWNTGILPAPNTVTYNGGRNYSMVFNSVDLTSYISSGMKLKGTRTVTAPTQCADLETSSSQYFSKTSPAGLSFTDDFTCMAWVKLESYTEGGIIARRNGDTEGWSLSIDAAGHIQLTALRIAGNNAAVVSYASIPLNKWVHVAASYDLSGTTAATYIDGVEVASLKTVTGTCTALVQGTTALVVGAEKSAGTFPFDGKIAQAAVFSSVLSADTIRSYASQGLAGNESTLVSAYSLSNSLLDLTANDNDLTANGGALATNVDSPFAGGANASTAYTAGTTEFAEVFNVSFSTNTTLVVQVPEGYMLPTSGGVSALSYSTQANPLGWPGLSNTIGFAQVMASQAGISSLTDLNGLVTTVYVPAGRRIRINAYTKMATQTNGAHTQVVIAEGAGILDQAQGVQANASLPPLLISSKYETTPTTGSHTYKLQAQPSAGTTQLQASATSISFISVELV